MVKNAITWAKNNKLVRTSDIHGAEEYRVKTFESFNQKDLNRSTTRASAEAELEDCWSLAVEHLRYGVWLLGWLNPSS